MNFDEIKLNAKSETTNPIRVERDIVIIINMNSTDTAVVTEHDPEN